MLDYITDFFFPKICLISDYKIPANNSNPFVLDNVIQELDRPIRQDIYLLENKLDSNHSFVQYVTKGKNNVNQILHYLKYKGFSKLGLFFGEYISTELIKAYPDIKEKYDFISPVPLHKNKVRERGYNQSEFIAKGLNKNIRIKYLNDLVIRTRYTKSQTTLPVNERVTNVKDAFSFNDVYKNVVKRKRVILVDDVVTTGSTLNEVMKVLKGAGVSNIFAVTLAMAKGE